MRTLRQLLRRGPHAPEPDAGDQLLATATAEDRRIVERALPYTMTGAARLQALVDAVRYCVRRGVAGRVRRVRRLARRLGAGDDPRRCRSWASSDRDIYLYDTFEGMTEPDRARHVAARAARARAAWQQERGGRALAGAVRRRRSSTRRPCARPCSRPATRRSALHFVRGPGRGDDPAAAPERIALLRLDTDWYESTRHELEHLYPGSPTAASLIIDDYGHWEGAPARRRRVLRRRAPLLLTRIDYTGRIAVKH